MKNARAPLTPNLKRQATNLGERLSLARRRRKISAETAAARARTSRSTISRLENGDARVSIDILLRLLSIYGLSKDVDALAADDQLGRTLQDADLPARIRHRE